jgi:hypothetical protein
MAERLLYRRGAAVATPWEWLSGCCTGREDGMRMREAVERVRRWGKAEVPAEKAREWFVGARRTGLWLGVKHVVAVAREEALGQLMLVPDGNEKRVIHFAAKLRALEEVEDLLDGAADAAEEE